MPGANSAARHTPAWDLQRAPQRTALLGSWGQKQQEAGRKRREEELWVNAEADRWPSSPKNKPEQNKKILAQVFKA